MDKNEIKKRILEEEDYIRAPKFNNSLSKFLAKNPDGVENGVIARLLMSSEEEVEALHQKIVEDLREKMVDENE